MAFVNHFSLYTCSGMVCQGGPPNLFKKLCDFRNFFLWLILALIIIAGYQAGYIFGRVVMRPHTIISASQENSQSPTAEQVYFKEVGALKKYFNPDNELDHLELKGKLTNSANGFNCCAFITSEDKNALRKIWTTLTENNCINCILLYRGVEVQVGRIEAETILQNPNTNEFCVPIPEQHEYLLFRDASYESFVSTLDNNVTSTLDVMEQAFDKVKNIPSAGSTDVDRKYILATFYEASLHLEKSLPHVEIGSYKGFSGVLTATYSQLLQFPEDSRIEMISPKFDEAYRGSSANNTFERLFLKAVKRLGIENRVWWSFGRNTDVKWTFGPVKSIFEDTIHTHATVSQSNMLILRYLVEGGLAAFHDMRCPNHNPGMLWAFELFANSGFWKEVVYPIENNKDCKCPKPSSMQTGCNYIRVYQRRVTQPPLGVAIVIEGNPQNTTFHDIVNGGTQYQEIARFRTYQDFWLK